MDLLKDFSKILKNDLLRYGYDPNKECKPENILFTYLNFTSKLINSSPRKIFISEEIKAKESKLSRVEADALNQIKALIHNGGDVNPFLSKKAIDLDFKDYLLNAWGILHLHLNGNKTDPKSYFNDRSDCLLFIYINNDNAYFIDILKHKEKHIFAKKELIEVIDNNWPELLEPFRLKGLSGSQCTFSNKDIKELRNAHVNPIIQIGDNIYAMVVGGLTTAGTNVYHTMQVRSIQKMFKEIQKNMFNQAEFIKREIEELGIKINADLDFKLVRIDNRYYIREINSKVIIGGPILFPFW